MQVIWPEVTLVNVYIATAMLIAVNHFRDDNLSRLNVLPGVYYFNTFPHTDSIYKRKKKKRDKMI